MTEQEILARVAEVIGATFPRAAGQPIGMASTADEVEGWDSLSHALFLMNLERALGLRFEPVEVIELENIGDLVRLIVRRQGAAGRAP
jgi:acyl carrier protein